MFRDSPRIQHRTYIEVEDDPVRLGRGEQVTINNEEDCPPPLSSIAIPERWWNNIWLLGQWVLLSSIFHTCLFIPSYLHSYFITTSDREFTVWLLTGFFTLSSPSPRSAKCGLMGQQKLCPRTWNGMAHFNSAIHQLHPFGNRAYLLGLELPRVKFPINGLNSHKVCYWAQ